MLTRICQYLRNWFDKDPFHADYPKYYGLFAVTDGVLTFADGTELPLVTGQYYRLMGSRFSDGVQLWQGQSGTLADEPAFAGAVWDIRIPPAIIDLADEMEAWEAKYSDVDSAAMSPFQSESFGGYSYSKASGTASSDGSSTGGVFGQADFAARLNQWRKM